MRRWTALRSLLGDEGVGRLLDAIMQEAVLLRAGPHEQAFLERGLEAALHLVSVLQVGDEGQHVAAEKALPTHAARRSRCWVPEGSWRSWPTMKSTTLSE